MKHWLYSFGGHESDAVRSEALDAFRRDLIDVCRKHSMAFTAETGWDGVQDITLRDFFDEFAWDWLFDEADLTGATRLRDDVMGARERARIRAQRDFEMQLRIATMREFIEREKVRAFGDDRSAWERAVGEQH